MVPESSWDYAVAVGTGSAVVRDTCGDLFSDLPPLRMKLKGVKICVLNTVKRGKHISHYALEEAIEICRRVGAEESYLTHLSHMLPRHAAFTEELSTLPFSLQPAYDGLTVTF